MVFFTCSHCGDSVKKAKVEKHYNTKCKNNPIAVSCVDCCKDFSAETFPAHTKCLTENEKYSAKGTEQKPSSNKGEVKQEKWQDVIKSLKNSSDLTKQEQLLINILVKHPNVPRKKVKFNNFAKNVMKSKYNEDTANRVFDKIEAESKKGVEKNETNSKLTNGKENKSSDEQQQVNGKRKVADTGDGEKKKKKRKKHNKEGNVEAVEKKAQNGDAAEKQEKTIVSSEQTKFEWNEVITQVLTSSAEKELPLKKLRKKVIAQLKANAKDNELDLNAMNVKFYKKVKHIPGVEVLDDKAKLVPVK